MSRKLIFPDYEATLNQPVLLSDVLPPTHLSHFVIAIIAQLDLTCIYRTYAAVGGAIIAPQILLVLLFYGYATGVFSSRKIERATYENVAFRLVAGGYHLDHDTIANFRKTFLEEIKELFVQIL
jgi:transposase